MIGKTQIVMFFVILFPIKVKVLLKNGWNSKQMIIEGDTAIPLETIRRASFGNQEKSKQRSAIVIEFI